MFLKIGKKYRNLERFIQKCIKNDIYPENPSEPHISITKDMIKNLNDIKSLNEMKVLDAGCGQGLALEEFKKYGSIATGLTFGEDYKICKKKGFQVHEMDMSFLEFKNKTFDIIWCRHALEHSIFPFFTLHGFYEKLKDDGLLYVEVPSPTTSARHERNPNHYSCFTKPVWEALFIKIGFIVINALDINFLVGCGPDTYHAFYLKKLKKEKLSILV